MRSSILLVACGLWLVWASVSAFAAEPPRYNRISLSESAQTEVRNDLMIAVVVAQAEGRNTATPADEVNRTMDWAVSLATSMPDVKAQTLGYDTRAIHDEGKVRVWRVSQSLRLESTDSRLLGDLIARLQEKLGVRSLTYRLSDAQRRLHLDDLTVTALKRFEARADTIVKAMQRDGYRLVQLRINDGNPRPVARGAMMKSASAEFSLAPARIEAGSQTMSVTISGEIELSEN